MFLKRKFVTVYTFDEFSFDSQIPTNQSKRIKQNIIQVADFLQLKNVKN